MRRSGSAKALGNLSLLGCSTNLDWIIRGQGPVALALSAGGSCLVNFSLVYLFSVLSPSLGDGPI